MATEKPPAQDPGAASASAAQADTPDSSNMATANSSAPRRSTSETRTASSPNRTQNTPAPPPLRKQLSGGLATASSISASTSPRTSRNTSPIRKDNKPSSVASQIASQPSAAAIQRALSAANVPGLQGGPTTEATRAARAGKSTNASGDATPQWPISPRLKSPPPSGPNSRRGSTTSKKPEASAAPSINVQNATPQTSTPPPPARQASEESARGPQLQTAAKAPSRGASGKSTLETVQENSMDEVKEPSPAAVKAASDLKPLSKLSEEEGQAKKQGNASSEKPQAESGSESAGKAESKKPQIPSAPAARPKNATTKSYTPLASAKSRQGDGKQGMTVETETVPSIPQSAIGTGEWTGGTRNDGSGTVRSKISTETIRPKKERKKPTQKARSLNQGTASSKADIFEARVANAVEDANSSDSDETFVYESNPPEPNRRRHHSRTPSVASQHSTADGSRSGIRNFGDMMDERRVAGKRSMKFSNNPYNDPDTPEGKDGSARSHTPRHFGRFGRGGNHQSMFDQDSPFTQASKLRTGHFSGVRGSRPNSPRSPQMGSGHGTPRSNGGGGLFSRNKEPSYDFDAEGADDERTPLVGTVRTPRRYPRRLNSSNGGGSIDEYYGVRSQSRFRKLGGCVLAFCVFAVVILSAVAFLVMSNRPMYEVQLDRIENVLASEEELMLDLYVGAVNPNALGITVTEMDVNVFAKSKHVGNSSYWRRHGHLPPPTTGDTQPTVGKKRRRRQVAPESDTASTWQDLSSHWHAPSPPPPPHHHRTTDNRDDGTDPPAFDEPDAQTMLLGRIFHLDTALAFDGSPIKRHLHFSTGELRLEKPGNKTEAGGSERWEEVLKWDFELIVRGVLKYRLPISSRVESAAVSGSCVVHPEEGVLGGRMRVSPVEEGERWEFVDWPLPEDRGRVVEEVEEEEGAS